MNKCMPILLAQFVPLDEMHFPHQRPGSARGAAGAPSGSPMRRPVSASGRPRSGGAVPGITASQLSSMTASFEEEMGSLLDSVLSEEDIAAALGCSTPGEDLDLASVRRIRLCIDTNKKSVSELGRMLPRLEELVLDGSRIASIRDLGTDLRCLRVLSLNDCNLYDLEGVSSLLGLEELYLRNNAISELVALTMHDNLKVLDLHSNRICDLSGADALSSCPRLHSLCLTLNPIERCGNYRSIVSSLIPQLNVLDGSALDKNAASAVTHAMILDASTNLRGLQEALEDEQRLEDNLTDSRTPNTRTKEHANPIDNPSSAVGLLNASIESADTGSELTHGSSVVLAGGVAAAMRRRRADKSRAEVGNEVDASLSEARTVSRGSEELSTLMVLDAALQDDRSRIFKGHGKGQPGASNDVLASIVTDGDVTVSVLGHQPSSKQAVKKINQSVEEEDETGSENLFDYLKSSSFRQISSDKSGRGNMKTSRDMEVSTQVRSLRSAPELLRDRSGSFRESLSRMSQDSRPASSSGRPSTASSSGDIDGRDSVSLSSEVVMAAQPAPFLVKNSDAYLSEPTARKSENQLGESVVKVQDPKPQVIGIAASVGPSSKQKKPLGSIVHLDVVKRRARSSTQAAADSSGDDDEPYEDDRPSRRPAARKGIFQPPSGSIDSGEDDDDEDICVDHSSRHRMMLTRGKNKRSVDSGLSKLDADRKSGRPPIIPSSKETFSSIAGGSLGFDLSGSLAAINRWVEEEDEIPGRLKESFGDHGNKERQDVADSEGDVLSRQKIYSMCQGVPSADKRHDVESDGEGDLHELIFEDDAAGFGSGARYMSEPDDEGVVDIKVSMSPKGSKVSARAEISRRSAETSVDALRSRDVGTAKKSKLRSGESIAPVDSSIMGKRALRTMRREEDDDDNDLSDLHDLDRLYAENDRMLQMDVQIVAGSSISHRESKNSDKVPASRAMLSTAARKSPRGPASSAFNPQHATGEISLADNAEQPPSETVRALCEGAALSLSDAELVEMLNRPPKLVHELRTRTHFQDFFRGMKLARMVSLLEQAYASELNPENRRKKVEKRLDLVRDVLV